ncbi:MAG TPA: DNA polymerase ligase N-terminal domain-containing protein, partial [Bacteroidia bacterium]|nr:DNA polymerase ligase N-terminal domain-containing protein [Bacteroidia bacterium]
MPGLKEYRRKREFTKTAEPKGKKKRTEGKLLFVVQQHAATNLHYDFRLEMKGVLKSWAVPKGPSMNPADKRLAMMVEDHPYDYKDFEGNIPEGNYGAGNVIVWDKGTYHAPDAEDGAGEKQLLAGLHKGKISIVLHGKKLKGEFTLIKTSGRGANAWLLMKKNDEYASQEDILKKSRSVISKKTLEDLNKIHPRKPSRTKPERISRERKPVSAPIKVRAKKKELERVR